MPGKSNLEVHRRSNTFFRYKNLTPTAEGLKGPLTDKLMNSDAPSAFPDVQPFSSIVELASNNTSTVKDLYTKVLSF